MELPVADPGPVRAEGLLLQCPYCDSEAMHKLAQFLLPGLAAVCIDCTTGDLFRKPSVVAVDMRKEMVDYVTQRSETFISDSLIESEASQDQENEMPVDPFEIVSIFMDDFSSTKRNIIGHVSGWLMSDSREDKIDDFVQEMEMTRFWPLERREVIAEVLLKNVEPENQNCEKRLLRRDMDRHCVTVCPMRPMKCPFGCDSSFPERNLEQHCSEFLQAHLHKLLKVIHKKGFTDEGLKDHALLLEKHDNDGKLAKSRDHVLFGSANG
ncbi:Os04g0217900 [Oryza sativa Japonica Group]|uniref:Os04g0217900 protein n=1 Tax=Oryza sativa subsp. japonica TaxID=39947 RepID=C7J1K6_ORYSJ|nr:Os04g0217900 [Oryza sativa Japonica Group]|eukprot:NP_001173797.1 Os04g0217900 [Oryza sativa Japonica Group]